jgi:hypothetical protein
MYTLRQHSPQFGYLEKRPMTLTNYSETEFLKRLHSGAHFESDCSETVTAVFKWSGFRDPNNMGYDGYGNSETMLNYLKHFFSARLANIGSIVHFQNPDHVGVVYQTSRIRGNPLIWEHGAPGIAIVPLSVEKQFHSGTVTFLSILKL